MKTNFEFNESELFIEIQESISLIYNYCETCAHSDDASTLEKDLRTLFDKAGLDYNKIEEVSYYENPFSKRNWEYHNLGFPNLFSSLMLKLYQLRVRTFETLLTLEPENEKLKKELTKYRHEFEEIYDNSYHVD